MSKYDPEKVVKAIRRRTRRDQTVWRRERPLSFIPEFRGTCASMHIGIRTLGTSKGTTDFESDLSNK